MLMHAPVSIAKFRAVAPSRSATLSSGESAGARSARLLNLILCCHAGNVGLDRGKIEPFFFVRPLAPFLACARCLTKIDVSPTNTRALIRRK